MILFAETNAIETTGRRAHAYIMHAYICLNVELGVCVPSVQYLGRPEEGMPGTKVLSSHVSRVVLTIQPSATEAGTLTQ